jgi:tetratricopeptide (TPR) repeat protein
MIRCERLDLAARLAVSFGLFSWATGRFTEGRYWTEAVIQHEDALTTKDLGRVLDAYGRVLTGQGQFELALTVHERALAAAREADDDESVADALTGIGYASFVTGDQDRAQRVLTDALSITRSMGDIPRTQSALDALAGSRYALDDLDGSTSLLEESLALSRSRSDRNGMGATLTNLAELALRRYDHELALAYAREAVEALREVGAEGRLANATGKLAAALIECSPDEAGPVLQDALSLALKVGDQWATAEALENCALAASRAGLSEDAVALYAVSERMNRALGVAWEWFVPPYDEDIAKLKRDIDDFATAWERGETMPLEAAADLAFTICSSVGARASTRQTPRDIGAERTECDA